MWDFVNVLIIILVIFVIFDMFRFPLPSFENIYIYIYKHCEGINLWYLVVWFKWYSQWSKNVFYCILYEKPFYSKFWKSVWLQNLLFLTSAHTLMYTNASSLYFLFRILDQNLSLVLHVPKDNICKILEPCTQNSRHNLSRTVINWKILRPVF